MSSHEIVESIVLLFYSHHIKNERVIFPIGKENEYISDELPGIVQLNRNYLFVKRFTAKEEKGVCNVRYTSQTNTTNTKKSAHRIVIFRAVHYSPTLTN